MSLTRCRRWQLAIILTTTAIIALHLYGLSPALLPYSALPIPAHHRNFELYRHLGHLSPFFIPPNTPKSLNSGLPPGCAVSKAFLVHRHGSRHPHANELDIIQDLSDYIKNSSALFSNPHAELPDAWSFLLEGWNANFGTDDLTAPGRQQLFDHGIELRLQYPELYAETNVLAGDEDRVVESARWFMDGYYGRASNSTAKLDIIGEDEDTVSWITPHKSCAKWNTSYGDDVVSEWQAVYLPPIAERINGVLSKAYPDVNFTAAHVRGMLFACAYGTSVHGVGSSPWCPVFLPEEIMQNEYESDLRMRGFSGYGLPGEMGSVLGSLLVGNMTAFLKQDTGANVSFNFGHDKTIALGLTALGLASDGSYPPTGPVNPDRSWRAAKQMPFAGNMLFKRLECADGERIQLTLNGANFGLGPIGCDSDEFGSCAFEEFLSTNPVRAAMNVTHGDRRWTGACSRDENREA
ncbi:phosphoglycerate mutase-like protein [Hypoxylon sp. FL1150]|nr:phosphoglycerate mutase-like protein [Hypoxylon sp. FL1150]